MRRRVKQMGMPTLEQLQNEREHYTSKRRFRQTLLSTAGVLIVAAAITVLITMLLLPVYRIYSSSMDPTLENGQIVVAVRGTNYHKGDIVAYYYGNKLLISRVIADPEDQVDIRENGEVRINGNVLDEPYASGTGSGESDLEYPVRVPEEHRFLMGDNRDSSVDSRDARIGCVSEDQIVGKVIMRIWPLKQIKLFNSRTEQ